MSTAPPAPYFCRMSKSTPIPIPKMRVSFPTRKITTRRRRLMRVSSYRVVGFPRRGFRSEIGRIRLPGMRVFRKNSGFSLLKCQVQPMRGLHILCYIYADLPESRDTNFLRYFQPRNCLTRSVCHAPSVCRFPLHRLRRVPRRAPSDSFRRARPASPRHRLPPP